MDKLKELNIPDCKVIISKSKTLKRIIDYKTFNLEILLKDLKDGNESEIKKFINIYLSKKHPCYIHIYLINNKETTYLDSIYWHTEYKIKDLNIYLIKTAEV